MKKKKYFFRPEGTNSTSSPEANPNSAASTVTTTASASEMEDVDAIKVANAATSGQPRSSTSGHDARISGGNSGANIPASLSSSSFAQVKQGLKAAIGASPPPPYEVSNQYRVFIFTVSLQITNFTQKSTFFLSNHCIVYLC